MARAVKGIISKLKAISLYVNNLTLIVLNMLNIKFWWHVMHFQPKLVPEKKLAFFKVSAPNKWVPNKCKYMGRIPF